jgi:hypothetical protein
MPKTYLESTYAIIAVSLAQGGVMDKEFSSPCHDILEVVCIAESTEGSKLMVCKGPDGQQDMVQRLPDGGRCIVSL